MRNIADNLEKGQWYCDLQYSDSGLETFLRFSHEKEGRFYFSEQKGNETYDFDYYKLYISISSCFNYYIATEEDIKKFNLNE